MQTLLAPQPPAQALPPPARRRSWRRWALRGVLFVALICTLVHLGNIFLGDNFHPVIPGKIYRCAQPDGADLAHYVKAHGIRTVINLRGPTKDQGWYLEECTAAHDLNLSLEDFSFSAKKLPPASEVQRLIELLDVVEYPVVVHCRQGIDRTGVVAVIVRLLYTDDALPRALRHLSARYGHFPLGDTTRMDVFFDLYGEWLERQGKTHTPALFRHWIAHEYRGGWFRQQIESVAPMQETCRVGAVFGFRVRVRNTSDQTWHFQPFNTAGVHLAAEVWGPQNKWLHFVRAGQMRRDVKPGASIELVVSLPALEEAGRHRLRFSMMEENHAWFDQIGDAGHEEEIVVHE
jgi:protein tyrosine phosphatase (PTP) superfamily phosphohydrolase (DUF442 family)